MLAALVVILLIVGAAVAGSIVLARMTRSVAPTDDGVIRMSLRPGVYALTPIPLAKGEQYKVTLSGIYEYREWWSWYYADACYYAPGKYYNKRYRELFFDRHPVNGEPFEQDRFLHRYSFLYVATGEPLSILLDPPGNSSAKTRGKLQVIITVLSESDKLVLERPERERREREEQARLEAERQQQAELQTKQRQEEEGQWRHRLRLQEQVKALQIRTHLEANILDPEYRNNLATYHREKVLARKSGILDRYAQLMRNNELVATIRQEAPQVLDFMEAEVELVRLAERKDAEPPSQPGLSDAQRPTPIKLTEEEVRARKAHRKTQQARDTAAEMQAQLDSVIEFKESLERYPLDEDEKTRMVQDYYDQISTEKGHRDKKLE